MFHNPVTVASGTFGTKDEYASFFDYNRLGAVITKTITREPRDGNPMPRICETPSGMLNAIGLQNKGVEDFLENKIPFFRKLKTNLIVNIAGNSVDDYVFLAGKLQSEKCVKALELNISCPNVKKGLSFCASPELAYELVKAVRDATTLPLFTKLSPEGFDLLQIADACIRAGTNALTLINTLRGMAVDIETRKPKISRIFGGLSGPAIRPIALRYLYEVKKRFQVPVLSMGGIGSAEDALEFLITGADLVAVGTANFVNPNAAMGVLTGIKKYMKENRMRSVQELRGSLRIETGEEDRNCVPAG